MAKNDSRYKRADTLLDDIESGIKDLYKTTYSTDTRNIDLYKKVTSDLDKTIDDVIQNDQSSNNVSNTVKLLTRISASRTKGGSDVFNNNKNGDNILDLFEDNTFIGELMNIYADNKWIKQIDAEIDMILKYMPDLKIALDIKKDNVLSSDSFTKSFINVVKENDIGDTNSDDEFVANVQSLKDTFNIEEFFEKIYDEAATYGEYFHYQVPYEKAFKELLKRKQSSYGSLTSMREESIVEDGKLNQSFRPNTKVSIDTSQMTGGSIKIRYNRTGILEDAVMGVHNAMEAKKKAIGSIYESYITEVANESPASVHLDKTIPDKVRSVDDPDLDYAKDGFYDLDKAEKANNKIGKIKAPGCTMRKIPREDIVPIYIEDLCLGYYVINMDSVRITDDNVNITSGFNSISQMYNTNATTTASSQQGDDALRYISSIISNHIDSNFINANQDLSKEIYMILKYNDKYNRPINTATIDVVFIPPEDIVHVKFRTDPRTHRGISDIWDGVIPAKMWVMLNSVLSLGVVTRGQDRRVYYVKQNIETNVAKSLLNVISQIKKGNFGIRQMESINNILGLLGKFNDFVIPVGPSGDPPINFEIMPGQQIDFPTDLMQGLKESAVNASDVPLEVVQSSNNMDFAIRYSMTNSKFLRVIFKRQAKCQYFFSKIFTTLYNSTYHTNYKLKVVLPAPAYLTMVNGSQLVDNAKQYINSIMEYEMADADDKERNMFASKMLRYYLPTHINTDIIDKIKDEIKVDLAINKSMGTGNDQEST